MNQLYKDILNNLHEESNLEPLHLNSRVLLIDSMNTFLRSFAMIPAINPQGNHIGGLVGCGDESNLYLWTRMSTYNRDDDADGKDITLMGVTYKPMNNISFKFETGTAGDDDVMRVGLGYMF